MRPIVVATLGLAALSITPLWMASGCAAGSTQQAATTVGTGGGEASSSSGGHGGAGGTTNTGTGGKNTGGGNTGGANTGGSTNTGGGNTGGTGGGACVPSTELCDGVDNNCDGVIDEGCTCKNGDTKPCYTGDPATQGIGECHGGVSTCDLMGVWGSCVGEVTPTTEICDGLDNDCNGSKDEGLGQTTCGVGICTVTIDNCIGGVPQTCVPGTPEIEKCDGVDNNCDGTVDEGCSCLDGNQQSCYTGPPSTMNVGECKPGTQLCQGGQWGPCENQILPTTETCNAKDDDCDGSIDDGLGTSVCGVGECQRVVNNCEGGTVQTCQPGQPSAETCDGKDNDCNGTVDDGLGTISCGIGACANTVPSCKNGAPNVCNPLPPQVEVCNGIDDNCNGTIDDGDPGSGAPCNTGLLGVCAAGTMHCVGGSLQCVQNVQPSAETCDGKDNDCNGMIDDGNPGGGVGCPTGLLGICAAGVTACTNGAIVCNQLNQPTAEVCDGTDNNCNGGVDEGNPGGGLACDTMKLGACAAGTTACQSGSIICVQNVAPTGEVCDGIDNNCNGQVDEGNPGGGLSCNTGLPGICQPGTTACTNGAIVCNQNLQPSAEVCDGKDNDCNGQVDDGNPGGGLACTTNKLGVCAPGTTACSNGGIVCNQNVQPSAETCDGKDNDCNGLVDDGNPGGGVACNTNKPGVCAAGTTACTNGAIVCNQNVQPSAEICDGKDNNCDGNIDEGNPGGGLPCNTGMPGVCAAGTTLCQNGAIICVQNVQPGPEICDGLDNNCNGSVDEGVTQGCYTGPAGTAGVGVCHSGTQTCTNGVFGACVGEVVPSAEVCDNKDNDCDGQVDNGVTQVCYTGPANTAGVGVCHGGTQTCTNGSFGACVGQVLPSPETCDGLDNDCNGQVDDGVKNTYYRDADGDGFGSPSVTTQACSKPTGYVTDNTDCDDSKAAVHPGATEVCNGIDDNCNGQIDEGVKNTYYADADGDGYGNAAATTQACTKPAGFVTNNTDCNDGNAAINPGAIEVCNGIDDNCNGTVDEGVKTTYYADADGDGFGNPAVTQQACSKPTGYVTNNTDCNDNNNAIYPGAPELCNNVDDNCNGQVDDGNPGGGLPCGVCNQGTTACSGGALTCLNANAGQSTYYLDADGDGYGTAASTVQACSKPAGYVTNSTDCNDNNAAINPSATEICNGSDDNCNGLTDDNATLPADGNPTTCSTGMAASNVTAGSTVTKTGYISGTAGDADWYKFTFANTAVGGAFHPKITLSSNPGTNFKFLVYTDCGTTPANACTGNLDTFEMNYTYLLNGNPSGCQSVSPAANCTDNTGRPTTIYVKVIRVTGAPFFCGQYTLQASL